MVDETWHYSAAEMERMMKVQDVLLKAMAKKITWWAAAEIIGVTDRTMRRWREKLEKDGYAGLADRRKGKPSAQRIPLATIEKVLGLYKETYYDLNIRHFHEKLRDEHAIELSYTWVQKALQGAGLVAKRHKRGPHRRRRPRRPLPGMLLHIDGSKHRWLNDERWYDLIVILDDATSEIYYAQLVEEESTRTVMAGLREVIESQGLFCALYSDRGSHFFVTVKEGEKVDKHRLTQVGRAMKELGVQMIAAYSPQARGRSERSFGTWQGRLPQELRLAGISTAEGANTFLRRRYIGEFNTKFSMPAAEKGTAFRRTGRTRPELDLHGTDGASGGQGQHGGHPGADVADRQNPIPQYPGGEYGHDPRASGRNRVDPLRPSRGGSLQQHGRKADQRDNPKSAVEKVGVWKPAKTKSRFPPAPTLPWKSRQEREIPTFPPRRLRLVFYPQKKQRPKPKPQKQRPKRPLHFVSQSGQITNY